MRSCHLEVIRLDWNRREDVLNKSQPSLLVLPLGQVDADEQFGGRDCRDHYVVVIRNDSVERGCRALGRDEDSRVEYQPFQVRSSIARAARSSRNSDAQQRSGGLERRICFTSFPLAARAGSIRATACPRRTTRKLSPRRSTASSTSENRRAASVAVSLWIKSDYQISVSALRRNRLPSIGGAPAK
jgi:hypothetical protein